VIARINCDIELWHVPCASEEQDDCGVNSSKHDIDAYIPCSSDAAHTGALHPGWVMFNTADDAAEHVTSRLKKDFEAKFEQLLCDVDSCNDVEQLHQVQQCARDFFDEVYEDCADDEPSICSAVLAQAIETALEQKALSLGCDVVDGEGEIICSNSQPLCTTELHTPNVLASLSKRRQRSAAWRSRANHR